MNKLPKHWVEALFKKFLVRYGTLWADRYKGLGLTPDEIVDEWATELGGFTPEEIKRGLEASRAKTFPPTLPEFLTLCRPVATVRPSADEAWALSLKAQDEAETVVWTQDMAEAWVICKPVMDSGDEVGARMAFKAAYDRICAQGRPVKWIVSEGWDPERRLVAIEKARSIGLAIEYKPEQLQQIEQKRTLMPESVRKLIQELSKPVSDGPSLAELERQETQRLKQQSAEKVAAYRSKL